MKRGKMSSKKDFIFEECEKKDVQLITLQFVDILGTPKSVTIPIKHLEAALTNGIGFDGSSVEGFMRIFESDMVAMPDPSLLPLTIQTHNPQS